MMLNIQGVELIVLKQFVVADCYILLIFCSFPIVANPAIGENPILCFVVCNNLSLSFSLDYLDNGNNKMAIQQADKLLKKHKDLHCAKVSSQFILLNCLCLKS